ncbi:hypothetical protein [Helicobacter sp. 11S02629-2]|uniref:hypothetical protein n=1 Tax=Helicobacter sp. 11S02629-2 TaxID=1476195 RepID=UPI000BA5EFA1|nr:hypothetical protein [Helicobacter sp. 11S02629-2]PAF45871.1 hypothetical protein BKH40_00205 [Helicobacter sp. 11S02629-2]
MKKSVVSIIALMAILGIGSLANANEAQSGNLICKQSNDGSGELICHKAIIIQSPNTQVQNTQTQNADEIRTIKRVEYSDDTGTSRAKKEGNSGFLLGIDLGITRPLGYGAGLRIGGQKAFTHNMGLRFYLSDNFAVSSGFFDNGLAANIDYYYNFVKGFGFYIGSGIGYETVVGGFGSSRVDFGDSGGGSFMYSSSSYASGAGSPNGISNEQTVRALTTMGRLDQQRNRIEQDQTLSDEEKSTKIEALENKSSNIAADLAAGDSASLERDIANAATRVSASVVQPQTTESSGIYSVSSFYVPINLGLQYDFGHSILNLGIKVPLYVGGGSIASGGLTVIGGYTYVW